MPCPSACFPPRYGPYSPTRRVTAEREVLGWKNLLASIVDQALLLHIAYLVTENRLLRNQIVPISS
jgi:hypothetical protein